MKLPHELSAKVCNVAVIGFHPVNKKALHSHSGIHDKRRFFIIRDYLFHFGFRTPAEIDDFWRTICVRSVAKSPIETIALLIDISVAVFWGFSDVSEATVLVYLSYQ